MYTLHAETSAKRSVCATGINIFLAGRIPTENLRFRDESLTFRIAETAEELIADKTRRYEYPRIKKTLGNFFLEVEPGSFTDSEIIVMLGENGTGKSTFMKMLADKLQPDEGNEYVPKFQISLKPQTIPRKFEGTVRQLLLGRIKGMFMNPQFIADVMKPMRVEELMDQEFRTLSGGEMQRVAIVLCLGIPSDIYLIDEPSAFLDVEQRITASKVIKR